jgi:hypothetical protein
MCGSDIMHEVQLSMNDQWHVAHEIRYVVFQGSFIIPPCKHVWKNVGSEETITKNICPDVDGEPLLVM